MFCSSYTICEMFFARIWFVKTSTRIVKYKSRVVKSNPAYTINNNACKKLRVKLYKFNVNIKWIHLASQSRWIGRWIKDVYALCLYVSRCIIHLDRKCKARSTNILKLVWEISHNWENQPWLWTCKCQMGYFIALI